jgi:putative ABC transport system permease protein
MDWFLEFRHGLRRLLKYPAVTVVAVLTLALGIGVNTAIFSVANALLLDPLPFPALNRIVAIWETTPKQNRGQGRISVANYLDWRKQTRSFEHLGFYKGWGANLTSGDHPERMQGYLVSANLLDVIGVKPVLGRGFMPEEEQAGKDNVVILTYSFWQRRFGENRNIIGSAIILDGMAREVVGVTQPGSNFPPGADILAPLALTPELIQDRSNRAGSVIGRLKDNVSVRQATAELTAVARRLEQQYLRENLGRGIEINPLLDDITRPYRSAVLLLMGAAGFVLLIACANVANLMIVQAFGRLKENAIRLSLGATRWRIARQQLIESAILATIGGALGLLIAYLGTKALKAAIPSDALQSVPGLNNMGINLPVLGCMLGIVTVVGMLSGLAPAIQVSKPDLVKGLREEGFGSALRITRSRLRGLFIIIEVALSLILLVGAGLMLRSFWKLTHINPGFNLNNVLTVGVALPNTKYREKSKRIAFFRDLTERVETLPGVESAGLISSLPLSGDDAYSNFLIEGKPELSSDQGGIGRLQVCTPHYFNVLGIELVKGRVFSEHDKDNLQPVVVINKALARKYWPDEDALGKRMRFPGSLERNPWMLVVGVVSDVKHKLNLPIMPEYYLPYSQYPRSEMVLAVRAKTEPTTLVSAIRDLVVGIDRDQPVFKILTMEQVRARAIILYSFSSALLGIFAVAALILAAVGLYGVISYNLTQRTYEIGVRIALGARPYDVMRIVGGQGALLISIGIAVGLYGAWGLARVMRGLLFDVATSDWISFTGSLLLLGFVAFIACCLPARRAMKIDPAAALKRE